MPRRPLEDSTLPGRNSTAIRNSPLSPARIETLDSLGIPKTVVNFDVVAREGQFTDTTIANYNFRGQGSSLGRYLLNETSKRLPNFLKGELTTQFDGITPKTLNFDIIYRADTDFQPAAIIGEVKKLQSLCYPRFAVGANPPLCILHVLNLYSLECFVQQVIVNWHNTWDAHREDSRDDINDGIVEQRLAASGLPMGCDISMSVLMHQYPTRDEILQGAGFDSTRFTGNGYSGTFESGVPSQKQVQIAQNQPGSKLGRLPGRT